MSHWWRAAGVCAVLAAVLLVPLPASGGIAWDVTAVFGYAAGAFALVLFIYPLRHPGIPHRRLSTLTQHRQLGWTALVLAVGHAGLLLGTEPLTAQYLLPSAPLYMLCGLAALLLLVILVPTGLIARRLMRRAPGAKKKSLQAGRLTTVHAVCSAALLGLIGAHVVGSGQLADKSVKVIVIGALLALSLAWSILKPRWRWPLRSPLSVVLTALVSGAVLLVIPAPSARSRLLEPLVARSTALPLAFPHERHREVNCLACHHNWVDRTGTGSCISCHRESSAALTRSAEATFHVFCRECHSGRAEERGKHGPIRSCAGCHAEVVID
jgi:Class III cytochrome C family